MHLDDILKHVGEFSRYQIYISLLLYPLYIIVGLSSMSMVFTLGLPDYRCAIPGLENDTYFIESEAHQYLFNTSIPPGSKCNVYEFAANGTRGEVGCNRWVYDETYYKPSVIMDFNLVCEKTFYRSLANTAYMVGLLFGAVAGGHVADRFGRKTVILLTAVIQLAAGVGMAFVPEIWSFMVLRLLTGAVHAPFYAAAFTLRMELTGSRKRNIAGFFGQFAYDIGVVLVAPLAYFIRNWRYLTLATVLPSVFLVPYWWFLPESPRWLLTKGRKKEANVIIRQMARTNGRQLEKGMLEELEVFADNTKKESFFQIFKHRRLVKRLGVMAVTWSAVAAGYYAIALNSGNLSGDIYINYTLVALMDFPASFYSNLLPIVVGRKKPHIIAILFGSLACISTIFVVLFVDKSHSALILTVLSIAGKFGITAGFDSVYFYTVELFPTSMRNVAFGVCSMCARIASIGAPFLADLGKLIVSDFSAALPLVTIGALCFVAGLLGFLLPDTYNSKLPDTIQDVVKGRNITDSLIVPAYIEEEPDEKDSRI